MVNACQFQQTPVPCAFPLMQMQHTTGSHGVSDWIVSHALLLCRQMSKREAERLATEIWAFKNEADASAASPITLAEATAVFLERRFFAIPRLVTEVRAARRAAGLEAGIVSHSSLLQGGTPCNSARHPVRSRDVLRATSCVVCW